MDYLDFINLRVFISVCAFTIDATENMGPASRQQCPFVTNYVKDYRDEREKEKPLQFESADI